MRGTIRIGFLIAALALAGCAGMPAPEPKVVTREVDIPVPVPCVVDPGPEPAWVDTDAALKAAPDVFAAVKLLLAGRLQHIAREGELTAAIGGCAKP